MKLLNWLIKLIKTEELQFKNDIISQKYLFWKIKRIFDVLICTFLLPVLVLTILILLILNKFYKIKNGQGVKPQRLGKHVSNCLARAKTRARSQRT